MCGFVYFETERQICIYYRLFAHLLLFVECVKSVHSLYTMDPLVKGFVR